MNTMHKLGPAVIGLLLVATSQAQSITSPTTRLSIRDNPGVLGHNYTDLSYSWVDYHRDGGVDADGYIAGVRGNMPMAPGFDLGLGYNYYRENNHRSPFNGTPYDARYHEAAATGTFYAPGRAAKPFVGAGLGYQWSRGDIQSLRTYGHEWVWSASGGVEFASGPLAFTPRISYTDTMRGGSIGAWHYGAQAHHWFNEKMGGYVDATFHDPRNGGGAEWWTYMAGLRFRF